MGLVPGNRLNDTENGALSDIAVSTAISISIYAPGYELIYPFICVCSFFLGSQAIFRIKEP